MAAVGVLLLVLGGVWMAAAVVLVICFAVYEEFRVLSLAGHRPVAWPTWVGVVLSIPVLALDGDRLLIPIAVGVCLLTLTWVIFRAEPKLEDCLMSILPLMSLVLPGMCAMKLALIEPQLQDYLFSLLASVALLMFSYYQTAFDVNSGKRRNTLAVGLAGAYFGIVALSGTEAPLVYGGCAVWALTNLCSLTPVRRRPNPVTEGE